MKSILLVVLITLPLVFSSAAQSPYDAAFGKRGSGFQGFTVGKVYNLTERFMPVQGKPGQNLRVWLPNKDAVRPPTNPNPPGKENMAMSQFDFSKLTNPPTDWDPAKAFPISTFTKANDGRYIIAFTDGLILMDAELESTE